MSWFLRGAQSAVFYYASCTPWHKYKHQRRRKQQNHADRAAREAYEREMKERDGYGADIPVPEMLYRQPSPQATNEFWADEIRMGPGPPPKRAKKHKAHKDVGEPQNGLEMELGSLPPNGMPQITVGDDQDDTVQSAAVGNPSEDAKEDAAKSYALSSSHEDAPRRSNLSRKSSTRGSTEDTKWNTRRFYQRQDEELWGVQFSSANPTASDIHLQRTHSAHSKEPSARALGSSRPHSQKSRPHAPSFSSAASITTTRSQLSAHLNVRAIVQATASTDSIYTAPRAPPINDDHPPVANNPLHSKKVLTKWMLQPTPAPSVMSGKRQVRRSTSSSLDRPTSRSGSRKSSVRRERNTSSATTVDTDEHSMRRQLSARLLADKMERNHADILPLDAERDNDADVEDD